MCIRDRPEILPEHLRVRVHIAGLKIYESVADIVTALKQVGQLVEIDRQRPEHSLFGVINRHIERLRTRLRDRRPVHSDRHAPIERGSRSPQLTAGDTLRSPGPYASDWTRFAGWCDRRGLSALPATPATLGAYLTAAVTDPAGPAYVPATLARWVAAVNFTHRQAGHPAPGAHPHVGELLAGIRRSRGRPPARRDALVTADLRAILAGLPGTGWPGVVAGRRDAALLVLGFAGAFRRAELAGLAVSDVRAHPSDGLHVMVRTAKNDPGRAGQVKAVPYGTEVATCGPCAWARWRAVVAAADAGGRVAVLRTVRADDPASHVCRSPAGDGDGDGDPAEPAFRKLDKTGRVVGAH